MPQPVQSAPATPGARGGYTIAYGGAYPTNHHGGDLPPEHRPN